MIMKKGLLDIKQDGLYFDGKPFYMIAGEMHYFRTLRGGWRRRLQLAKDFGLTAIQTYSVWNLHEPEEGQFCFDGDLDFTEFLDICAELDLKVLFRPTPYICGEWDFGGLPYWLRNKRGLSIRTSDTQFMGCVRRYFEQLIPRIIPYLSTNGGPIISINVEDEYGSFCNDNEYLRLLGEMMTEMGVDVPFYTTSGFEKFKLKDGNRPEYWTMVDMHKLTDTAVENLLAYQPDKPIMMGEFWVGRAQQSGGHFIRQTPEEVVEKFKYCMDKPFPVYMSYYMFAGGSDFGFMNGALIGKYKGGKVDEFPWEQNSYYAYVPFAQSYDVDAMVTEYGEPTPKYYALKKALKEDMERRGFEFGGTDEWELTRPVRTQSIQNVNLTESADLFDNLDNLAVKCIKSGEPYTFEYLDQAYGYVLYSTRLTHADDYLRELVIDGLHDYALVYGNGKYLGTYMRDRDCAPIRFKIPKDGMKLDILVENLGRVNYGHGMLHDEKGIVGYVKLNVLNDDGTPNKEHYNFAHLANWLNYSLPMKAENVAKADYTLPAKDGRPAIYKGEFDAEAGVDTFVNMKDWKKGVVYVNGFCLGRYWYVGPQLSLYVPGELIKEHNTVEIFELYEPSDGIVANFDDKPSLDARDGGEAAKKARMIRYGAQVG